MNQDEWYVSMAAAIKSRDHAIRMLQRWQKVLDSANDVIVELAGRAEQAKAQEPEQEHDTVV